MIDMTNCAYVDVRLGSIELLADRIGGRDSISSDLQRGQKTSEGTCDRCHPFCQIQKEGKREKERERE
jgi:hypothetical protein